MLYIIDRAGKFGTFKIIAIDEDIEDAKASAPLDYYRVRLHIRKSFNNGDKLYLTDKLKKFHKEEAKELEEIARGI